MCNRYDTGALDEIIEYTRARSSQRFNTGTGTVHPKETGLVVRQLDSELVIDAMQWGFPVSLRGKSGQPLKPKPVNNARFDKLGAFWKRWASEPSRRCLIPAARFAEAVGEKGRMTETWLSVRDAPIFAWAGLWTSDKDWGDCYTGVMTDAAPELMDIHDRCPVILAREDWGTWLNAPLADLYQFDRPWPATDMIIDATDDPWARKARL